METALMERETFESLMRRTQHLVEQDLGPRRCEHCGRNRSVERRSGYMPGWVCLAGCDTEHTR